MKQDPRPRSDPHTTSRTPGKAARPHTATSQKGYRKREEREPGQTATSEGKRKPRAKGEHEPTTRGHSSSPGYKNRSSREEDTTPLERNEQGGLDRGQGRRRRDGSDHTRRCAGTNLHAHTPADGGAAKERRIRTDHTLHGDAQNDLHAPARADAEERWIRPIWARKRHIGDKLNIPGQARNT